MILTSACINLMSESLNGLMKKGFFFYSIINVSFAKIFEGKYINENIKTY
jgi:hypothetical protein